MNCKECHEPIKERIGSKLKAVTCAMCVSRMVGAPKFVDSTPKSHYKMNEATGMPEQITTEPKKRGRPRIHEPKVRNMPDGSDKWPRCWWLKKEFKAPNGKMYYKGKEG